MSHTTLGLHEHHLMQVTMSGMCIFIRTLWLSESLNEPVVKWV